MNGKTRGRTISVSVISLSQKRVKRMNNVDMAIALIQFIFGIAVIVTLINILAYAITDFFERWR